MTDFDVNDRELRSTFLKKTLPDAIDRLQGDALPAWGTMTPQQMIEHLTWTFMISRGGIEVNAGTSEGLRNRIRPFLFDDRQMPREFGNPILADGLPPLRYGNLAQAIAALHEELSSFFDYGRRHPDAVHVHPVFGPLGMEEWERSHYKHCYHHLLQFGLLSSTIPPAGGAGESNGNGDTRSA